MRGSPLLGIRYFGRGFSLLSNKGLKRFVAFPILINALLMTALIYYGGGYLLSVRESRMGHRLATKLVIVVNLDYYSGSGADVNCDDVVFF